MGAYERVGGATCPPPADPTNLTATAASRTQIDLTWTDNATDETGYEVERSTDGGTTWSPLASLPANSQSHADTGLTCGTTYHYRVYATNADGNSGYSNVASATTDACRLYVDADSTGNNDGSSWADAFTSLQDALAVAAPGYEIWVAEGVYYPDEGAGQTNGDRAATFQLRDGVAIYGGFAGTETLLSQRDPAAHVTILSGDIGQDDLNADGNFIAEDTGDLVGSNSYHVVTGSGTDSSALLDGFTITAGQANATAPNDSGGGLYNSGGSPTLADITFSGNSATSYGGGTFNFLNSSPTLTDVTFTGNWAGSGGGMVNHNNSSPTLTNVTFSGNSVFNGGGMYNVNNSSPTLTGVTFSGNSATVYGGGMYNSGGSPTLTNVILWGNTAGSSGPQIFNSSSTP